METNSPTGLLALQERVKQALEETFLETVWLRAEISEMKQHPSGHCYLTLVEKAEGDETLQARASAIVWASAWRLVGPYFERETGQSTPALRVLWTDGNVYRTIDPR